LAYFKEPAGVNGEKRAQNWGQVTGGVESTDSFPC
jgi:hypothetical protein